MSLLYYAWYKDYSSSSFHFFNDNSEWLQVDKLGHAFCSYQVSRYSSDLVKWSGASSKASAWKGAGLALIVMSSIEVFDGFSSAWGFSLGDITANLSGVGLFLAQELSWQDQRIKLKYSYMPSKYSQYSPDLLGKNEIMHLFKDYNAQTNWISVNLSAFGKKESKMPSWISIAFGYGAEGMIGASANPPFDGKGNLLPNFKRNRRFFLSPDIELSRIKSKNKLLGILLKNFSIIKFPMPAIEYNSNGHWKFHGLYF